MIEVDESQAAPFQLTDVELAAKTGRFILGHKTGLGKTYMALMTWQRLQKKGPVKRVLILGGKSSLPTWLREIEQRAGVKPELLAGSASLREPIWERCLHDEEGIWVSTYDTFRIHAKSLTDYGHKYLKWDLIICDEMHRLRNRKVQAVTILGWCKSTYWLGLSATWARKGPQDLWAALHLLRPEQFKSYWSFVERFCYVERGDFGYEIYGAKDITTLRKIMQDYYVSRTYEEVAPQMPPIRREVVELEMTTQQRKMYNQLDEEMLIEVPNLNAEDGIFVTPSLLGKIVRLRQLCITPQLLMPDAENGAALDYLLAELEDNTHTVIFTDFPMVFPVMTKALKGRAHALDMPELTRVYTLKGGTDPKKVAATIEEFKKEQGIMLCSLQFAESFALDTVKVAYVWGFNWSPDVNEQAEGRLRRIDSVQPEGVLVKYLLTKGTVEEHVREVLNGKQMTVQQFINSRRIKK